MSDVAGVEVLGYKPMTSAGPAAVASPRTGKDNKLPINISIQPSIISCRKAWPHPRGEAVVCRPFPAFACERVCSPRTDGLGAMVVTPLVIVHRESKKGNFYL